MNLLVFLFLLGMILLCVFVFWTYLNTLYGYSKYEIITPYNTGFQSLLYWNNLSGRWQVLHIMTNLSCTI